MKTTPVPVVLMKREVLLDLRYFTISEEGETPGTLAWFDNSQDMDTGSDCAFTLNYEDWMDFGQPVQITVTILPGDRLNPSGEQN